MAENRTNSVGFMLRLPDGLREEVKAAAAANGRSMNAEIVAILSGNAETLRDKFAGQAMNGICAGLCGDASNGYAPSAFSRVGITEAAKDAYLIADEMLAARKGGA